MERGICKLCKKSDYLRHSHILPEFFYLNIYESREIHRAVEISREGEQTIQKGLREYLLCQRCETKLSRYEGYSAKLIRNIPNFKRDASGRFLFQDDVDYRLFKLFQLSILWRASISKDKVFSQVHLGPHEENIRLMLETENPGKSSDYGCVVRTMLETEVLQKIMSSPTRIKSDWVGHTLYEFMTGNLTWIFFITKRVARPQIQDLFLREDGLLRIWLSSGDENTQLLKIAQNMEKLERERM